jgi:hypothetical protein
MFRGVSRQLSSVLGQARRSARNVVVPRRNLGGGGGHGHSHGGKRKDYGMLP